MLHSLLAIDTSSEACSVAIAIDRVVYECFELAPRAHTRLLLPMIQKMLAEHQLDFKDLDAIAFGAGPGAFTGLRIAAGVTQGLAYAAKKPVIKVSTLAALALEKVYLATQASYVLPAIDARMDEVYWSLLKVENGRVSTICPEQVSKPEAMQVTLGACIDGPVLAAGSGWQFKDRMPEWIQSQVQVVAKDTGMLPRAGMIARVALANTNESDWLSPEQAIPSYVRNTVTWKKLPGRE